MDLLVFFALPFPKRLKLTQPRVEFLLQVEVSLLVSLPTSTNPIRNSSPLHLLYYRLALVLALVELLVVPSGVVSDPSSWYIFPRTNAVVQLVLDWQWFFWIQLIFGGVVQAVMFFMPESRSTILIDMEAKRRRKTGEDPNIYGPDELKKPRVSLKEAGKIWIRPFHMLLREPIVFCLSLLSGFSDALIFTFLESFAIVYEQGWGFGILGQAWAFIPINAAYVIAYFLYFPWFFRDEYLRKKYGSDSMSPERRLKCLLYLAPLEPIGLFGFAWTSFGKERNVHWIGSMIFSALVGIANYAIYLSTVDYMVAAYGVYSASATGGNAFARDLLAGVSAMYATPMYHNIGDKWHVEYATTVLACLSCVVVTPIYIFYWQGPWVREHSKFAQSLAADRKENEGRRVSKPSGEP